MRRILCFLIAATVCLSLAIVVLADGVMTPSVPSKDAPTIVPIPTPTPPTDPSDPSAPTVPDSDPVIGEIVDEKDDNVDFIVEHCLIVTPVSQATTSDKIPEEAKETLLDVYDQLSSGEMKLPYEDGVNPNEMVIKDLFDVSWDCNEHEDMVENPNNYVKLTFDADVAKDADVVVMVYEDDTWVEVKAVTNNGDGTITVVLENVGVVAISVPTDSISDTGDKADLSLWTVLLVVSAVALVAMMAFRPRYREER